MTLPQGMDRVLCEGDLLILPNTQLDDPLGLSLLRPTTSALALSSKHPFSSESPTHRHADYQRFKHGRAYLG